MRRIVFVTDCIDIAFNEMCGQVAAEADRLGVDVRVEPLVPVEAFSEINAAFVTRLLADSYPPGTIIVTLPAKSKDHTASHEVLWGETETGIFLLGSNFGYHGWLAKDHGVKRLFALRDVPLSSFADKWFISPVAARIAAGLEDELEADPIGIDSIHDMDIAEGTVVHIDNFGNAKVTLDSQGRDVGSSARVHVNGTDVGPARFIANQVYLQPRDGETTFYESTSFASMTDIAIVRGSFAGACGLRIGDVITLQD